jgi:chromosome segregation ATPase
MMESAWKSAARAWWERMRKAEQERDELLRRLEGLQKAAESAQKETREDKTLVARNQNLVESIKLLEAAHVRLKNKLSDVQLEKRSLEAETNDMRRTFLEISTNAQLERRDLEDLRMQLSGNPGEFADLAARIAEADKKHPRDLKDAESHDRESLLQYSRRRLRDAPTWENALRCEQEEALAEIASRNYERFADELLDVATVAMRWRRAVMERAK